MVRTSIGEFIAALRKAKGLTQMDVANHLGVSNKTVSSWETGASCPDIALLPAIAELYGVTCDELLGVQTETPKVVPEEMVDLSKVLLKLKIISHDGDIVNLNLPVQVAEPFIKNAKISGSDILQSIDFAQIIGLVKSGAVGKLLEINSADGDIVEICVE